MTAFTLCQRCGTPVGDVGHQAHDEDCDRFLTGVCRCDGWLCAGCCPDRSCTPLAARLAVAREDTYARAAVAEAAYGEPG